MTIPPMNEMVAFQKVASRLSFKKAADELSLTPSTLSHLVRSLEDRLKTRLLNRTTRSVSLTESGQKLFIELEQILNHLDRAITNFNQPNVSPSGTVRISVNESSAPILIKRLGSKFKKDFPDITIELSVENRLVDIVAEGFDAGVRLRDVIPKDMVAVPLVESFQFVAVASPEYIQKHGLPKTPDELSKHNCIGFRFQSGRLYDWEFTKRGKKSAFNVNGSLITNSARVLVDAAKDGIGIALIAEPLVSDEIESKKLVVILKGWEREWPGLYLYYPKNRHMPTALRVCIDALKQPHSRSRTPPS